MRAMLLRNTLVAASLGMSLLAAGFAEAQDTGHSPGGQVPGPNATPPQADFHASGGNTPVQPVPGAMPGSATVPSTLSEQHAAEDNLIIVAFTFKNLTDEERRAIHQALASQAAPGADAKAAMGIELPASVELRAMPADLVARIPQTQGYRYLLSGGRVFLVSPQTRIVVGEFKG